MEDETTQHATESGDPSKTPQTTPDPEVPDATAVAVDPVDITAPTEGDGEPVHHNEGGDLGAGGD